MAFVLLELGSAVEAINLNSILGLHSMREAICATLFQSPAYILQVIDFREIAAKISFVEGEGDKVGTTYNVCIK